MACGSAVVGVRGSALSDFAEHDRDSLLVEPGDVHTMAESLVRLMLDRELRTRLVVGGVRTAAAMDSTASAVALEKALHSWTGVQV